MMKKSIFSALFPLALAISTGLPLAAQAQVLVNISGTNENSEAACSQATVVIVNSDCTYTAARPEAFYGWAGPSFGGGYYPVGSIGDDITYEPVPGDGKIKPTISGSMIFNGSGAGTTIEGTIVMGPAVRNTIVGNQTRGVERWDAITHTLAATPVTTAAPNAGGGFDYVIGVNGLPGIMCLTADPSQCFPAETGSDAALFAEQNVWNNNVPATVGVEGTPLNGGPNPNIGTTTTAVISNYSSSCAVPTDCTEGRIVWSGVAGPDAEDPGFDNLILAISTDAAGNITSGEAWWTQEYTIPIGAPPRSTNSWQASRFTFTGAAAGADAVCADFGAPIVGGSTDNAIDALSRCTGFATPPVITIVTGPANGSATVDGAGNIIYAPAGGFSGIDTITYNGNDGSTSDNATLTLTVSPDPAPVIEDGAIDTGVSSMLPLTVTLGNGSAAQHTLSVSTNATNGNCTTSFAGGSFSVSYAPNNGFAGQDSCTLVLADANNDEDTALISITVPDTVITEIDGGGSAADPWSLLVLLGALFVVSRQRKVFFRATRVRQNAMLMAVVLAGPVVADDLNHEGLYLGAGIIGTNLQSDDPTAVTGLLNTPLAGSFEDFPFGGSAHAGWMWSDVAGAEFRYADSGDGDSSLRLRSTITGNVTNVGTIEAGIKSYTLYLVREIPDLPFSDRWSIYGKAGWTWQDLDVSFRSDGTDGLPTSGSASETSNGAAVAAGVRWRISRHWAVTGEGELFWVNFDNAFDEPWRFGLAVEYWFGNRRTEASR